MYMLGKIIGVRLRTDQQDFIEARKEVDKNEHIRRAMDLYILKIREEEVFAQAVYSPSKNPPERSQDAQEYQLPSPA